MSKEMSQARHPTITAASILCYFIGLSWSIAAPRSIVYMIRNRELRVIETPLGQIRGPSGPFEVLGIDMMIGGALLFYVINLLQILAGYWLWKSHRKGGILAISLLVLSAVFWWGFALPFDPVVGLLLGGLLAAGWRSLKGETA